jgi:hypothetical protein
LQIFGISTGFPVCYAIILRGINEGQIADVGCGGHFIGAGGCLEVANVAFLSGL